MIQQLVIWVEGMMRRYSGRWMDQDHNYMGDLTELDIPLVFEMDYRNSTR